uniref:Uncharacterized protein n=1 Tax=Anopheles epiroticus TaxID=199890 RepID=A0A182PQA0_9DIPT
MSTPLTTICDSTMRTLSQNTQPQLFTAFMARWRENRTIFNTPNPRLMNVSLLRDNKLLHGQERRGSRMSVRLPSRQPSMASLRPHSPNASIGSRRGSRGSSNASATSTKSNRSATHHTKDNGNAHPNESVTVEIAEIKT